MTLTAAVLNDVQQQVVEVFQGYSVAAQWFVGTPSGTNDRHPFGTVEVIALGDTFIWSFIIEPDGEFASSEATLGEFSTGVEI